MTYHIRDYMSEDADTFLTLNRYWIEKFFVFEPSDQTQLTDPDGTILAKDGAILIADLNGAAVGTIALIPKPELGHGTVEMVKMSVRQDCYGMGIGNALVLAIIERAKQMNATRIWLETNSALAPATHLYHKYGFKDLSADAFIATKYDRCNLQMELILRPE